MTKNQLEYNKNEETYRHNVSAEKQAAAELQEAVRANLVRESQNAMALAETARANRARESFNIQQLEETKRSNRAYEEYRILALNETKRANKANEYLKAESNRIAYKNLELTERGQNTNLWGGVISSVGKLLATGLSLLG